MNFGKFSKRKSIFLFIAVLVILPILPGAVIIEQGIEDVPNPLVFDTTTASSLVTPNELAGIEEKPVFQEEYWLYYEDGVLCYLRLTHESFEIELRMVPNNSYESSYGYYWGGLWNYDEGGSLVFNVVSVRVIKEDMYLLPDEKLDYLSEVEFTVIAEDDKLYLGGYVDENLMENPVLGTYICIFNKLFYNQSVMAKDGLVVWLEQVNEAMTEVIKKPSEYVTR